jgi:hypothetical protein
MPADYSVASLCIAKVSSAGDDSHSSSLRPLFLVPAGDDDGVAKSGNAPLPSNAPIVPAGTFARDSLITLSLKKDSADSPGWELLAEAGSARALLFELLHSKKVNPLYPQAVRDETEVWIKDPMIDGGQSLAASCTEIGQNSDICSTTRSLNSELDCDSKQIQLWKT